MARTAAAPMAAAAAPVRGGEGRVALAGAAQHVCAEQSPSVFVLQAFWQYSSSTDPDSCALPSAGGSGGSGGSGGTTVNVDTTIVNVDKTVIINNKWGGSGRVLLLPRRLAVPRISCSGQGEQQRPVSPASCCDGGSPSTRHIVHLPTVRCAGCHTCKHETKPKQPEFTVIVNGGDGGALTRCCCVVLPSAQHRCVCRGVQGCELAFNKQPLKHTCVSPICRCWRFGRLRIWRLCAR